MRRAMNVLVAVDDSQFTPDVLKAVASQFRPQDVQVRVIHVLQPISTTPPPQMDAHYAPELEARKECGRKLLEDCGNELRKAGFSVTVHLEIGDVRERIIDSAEEWPADLILVGSHGRDTLMRFLLGSVAESVARHAKCSVEIVRGAVARRR
jgi:nucleotide-binding universal stress UspA family protein